MESVSHGNIELNHAPKDLIISEVYPPLLIINLFEFFPTF